MYYVYILKSNRDKSLYTGFTHDLKRRFAEHNKGYSAHTRNKTPFELIYYEAYKSKIDAQKREKMLKGHAQAYTSLKRRIINSLNDEINEG